MKTPRTLLLPLVMGMAAGYSACGDEVRVAVDTASITNTMRGGMGASWHAIEEPYPTYNGMGGNPPFEDKAAWEQIYRHAEWLGMDWIRVEITQLMYEPERKKFVWDGREMQNLYCILDWCQRNDVDVFLQQMRQDVAWNAYPEWRNDRLRKGLSAPYSMEDFAEGLATLIEHLVKRKGYSCIKWLCITNEPGHPWSAWQMPPDAKPAPLVPGLEATRKALDKRGLDVPLIGPDWVPPPPLDPAKLDTFDHVLEAYEVHTYFARFDWREEKSGISMTVLQRRLADWAKWCHQRDKPFFLGELGSYGYGTGVGDPGPGIYEAALYNAEIVVRGLNSNIDGFNRWCFVNRAETGPQWQLIDTYDTKAKEFRKQITPHPNSYYLYGLLSRFTAKCSSVLSSSVEGGSVGKHQRVFASALRSPKGNLTLAVVNDARSQWDLVFELDGLKQKTRLYRYAVSEEDRDRADLHIEPRKEFNLSPDAAKFTDRVLPFGLTIYTTYNLSHGDPGIITENVE